jgi:hypothetical protein
MTELIDWYKSNLPRGNEQTRGDLSLGFRRQRNRLPQGNSAVICAGAGCPIKLPFTFTQAHIDRVREKMQRYLMEDTPAAERQALRAAVVEMELIVLHERLETLTRAEHLAYSVKSHKDYSARFTQDCVDQATNGTSYLLILAKNGLMKHHRVIHPGQINIFIFQPHFFTRIQEIESGHIYRFDLYHRGRFGIPPYVVRIS